MQHVQRQDVVISAIRSRPGDAVVDLFRRAFVKHPVSRLDRSLARAFLDAFAAEATFLTACDPAGRELGFIVGGRAVELDRIRARFIRRHALPIAVAAARNGLLGKLLLARARGSSAPLKAAAPEYQVRFIAFEPDMRGNGIGTQLLAAFEETLPSFAGYHLWTLAGEGAEGFYAALGLERDVELKGHVRFCKCGPAQ